ncbi:MBL fold metallo-hydrolase [Plantactinospora sp. CA-290183]|uniref:MBL fold metallo-hydrolase n=1 Tax=Plantactinospora sp. CA-290183 TaxID=3240006 RepID=UPI003D8C8CAB
MTQSRTARATATFVGTATTVLHLGEFTLLTDPNFLHAGQRAYLGYGLWTRRRTDPALRVEELPALDGVVLSHLHGDHFDRVARAGLSKSLPIITTPQAQRRLRRWGFTSAEALTTWESHETRRGDQTLRITAVPGRHGPGALNRLLPPVMGTIIDLEERGRRRLRLYITGDTLNRPCLAEIPERFPDIDAMLIHLGGTRLLGFLVTMDGRQGSDLVRLIRPGLAVPIHYDDYPVFRSPLRDFLDWVRDRGIAPIVRPIVRGETTVLLPEASGPPEDPTPPDVAVPPA